MRIDPSESGSDPDDAGIMPSFYRDLNRRTTMLVKDPAKKKKEREAKKHSKI